MAEKLNCNPVNMLKWVEALESGEYEQTRGALRTEVANASESPYKYCCLGVATEIAREEAGWNWPIHAVGILPGSIAVWLGLEPSNGDPIVGYEVAFSGNNDGSVTATQANDTFLWNFTQIASAIRETYALGE